ncbi:hypothetical protein ASC97_05720 [Rhizobium sp. Root1203]|uniref:hypothetical protein n=1 Tax=Rhizobium sp. Root1203 TaxID=1736427 RepID=UPI00070E092A|nr:hypothetical protein [Rhizobium sp. Root1203]KQV27861.1 hypothetical protein ASC97_05720 [Rhizobium sp. Root1203]
MYENLSGYTEEQLLESLKDPQWRIRNLYYILDKNKKTVLFTPNEVQELFLSRVWYRNIVPKARQRGFSTLIQLMMLDACLFVENQTAAVIAQDRETAEKIMRDKIEFAYDRLPDFIKSAARIIKDNVSEKTFSNGSSISVSTSARGTTLNWLHVSEYGVICYFNPLKAEEIVTGALPAAEQGMIFIESTSKGRDGDYYKRVIEAQNNAESGKKLSKLEYRLHFASWWDADEYEIEPEGIFIDARDHDYFDRMEREIKRPLSMRKRAWYIATRRGTFGDDNEKMWSEYPTTLEEAFKVSTEGVWLRKQLQRARLEDRIGKVPYRTGIPVNTFWDLGVADDIAIWFHQAVGQADHFIDYFECSDEAYSFVVAELQKRGYVWGHHFLPHDGDQRRPGTMALETPRDMLQALGLKNIQIVPRVTDLVNVGIQALREDFSGYFFDEVKCAPGIIHLENYRKQWNDSMQVWTEYPMKNGHQHAADALRQKAQARDDVRRLTVHGGTTTRPRRANRSGLAA